MFHLSLFVLAHEKCPQVYLPTHLLISPSVIFLIPQRLFFEYSVLKEHFKTVFASHHSGTINYRVVFFLSLSFLLPGLSVFSLFSPVCFIAVSVFQIQTSC